MGDGLAIVSEPTIKSLFEGLTGRVGTTESPFAKAACGITCGREEFWEGEFLWWNGELTLRLHLPIGSNIGMAWVLSGHEHAPGRRTDCVAGVMLRQAHALGGQAIQVGGANLGLAEAAQIRVAEIVRENEDDVGGSLCRGGLSDAKKGQEQDRFHGIKSMKTMESGLSDEIWRLR